MNYKETQWKQQKAGQTNIWVGGNMRFLCSIEVQKSNKPRLINWCSLQVVVKLQMYLEQNEPFIV